MAKTIDIQDKI